MSHRGRDRADRCAGPRGVGRHLAACREHRYGLAGHRGLQEGLSAGRDQHQNQGAGHLCRPGRQGVTSARQAQKGRSAGPSGDLAQASPPAGLGRHPVRRARHRGGRRARHQDRTDVGLGPVASSGRSRRCPEPGAQGVGSACRSSARGGHGTREAVGSACRSSARQPHLGFALPALGSPHEPQAAGLGALVLAARHRPPSLGATEPYGSQHPTTELTLPLRARPSWPAARPGRRECYWRGWRPCGRERRCRRSPQPRGPRQKAPKVLSSRAVPGLAEHASPWRDQIELQQVPRVPTLSRRTGRACRDRAGCRQAGANLWLPLPKPGGGLIERRRAGPELRRGQARRAVATWLQRLRSARPGEISRAQRRGCLVR
jgi:hypothetical protein